MPPDRRALVAASAFAVLTGRKVAGLYDHGEARHRRIAAECRGGWLQALDGDRNAYFGGDLPNLYDRSAQAHVTMESGEGRASGYDHASASHYELTVGGQAVNLYDYGEQVWFAYAVQVAPGSAH